MLAPIQHMIADSSPFPSQRTEDVKFSPSGRMLAVVATDGSIMLFAIDVTRRPIQINQCVKLHSDSLMHPHGIDFVNEEIIVVANRRSILKFYRIPSLDKWGSAQQIVPIHTMKSEFFGAEGETRKLRTRSISCGPGSVRIHGHQLFVCCNNMNTVTTHTFSYHDGEIVTYGDIVVAQDGLEVPDGVAVSTDGIWMAVSDHDHHCVVVYCLENNSSCCILRDVELKYPHGLCFDQNAKSLYVADAGARDLHVFSTKDKWDKDSDISTIKLSAVNMTAFQNTQEAIDEKYRALEGGIKGLDIDPSYQILATTCRNQTLKFFDICST